MHLMQYEYFVKFISQTHFLFHLLFSLPVREHCFSSSPTVCRLPPRLPVLSFAVLDVRSCISSLAISFCFSNTDIQYPSFFCRILCCLPPPVPTFSSSSPVRAASFVVSLPNVVVKPTSAKKICPPLPVFHRVLHERLKSDPPTLYLTWVLLFLTYQSSLTGIISHTFAIGEENEGRGRRVEDGGGGGNDSGSDGNSGLPEKIRWRKREKK